MISFEVNRKEFLMALNNVGNAVRDNKTIAAISGVYLDVKENSVEVKGTDLEMSIAASLNAKVKGTGVTVIKANTLQEYLREIDDEMIEIKEVGKEIVITTSKASSSYATIDHNDYPDTFNFTPSTSCVIDSSIFSEGIEKTFVGASATPDNLAVHSVRLNINSNNIKIITSDTYRLFYFHRNISTDDVNINVSLPLKTASSLLKIINNVGVKQITLSASQNLVFFTIGSVKMLSKLISLPYPDVENIMSNLDFNKEILCDRSELTNMLKRGLIFARNNRDVRNGAKFSFTDNKLEIEAISDIAKVKEDMNIVKKGDNFDISLNIKFILDFIQQISKNVLIQCKDENSAILLKESDKDDFICVTMPLSLG